VVHDLQMVGLSHKFGEHYSHHLAVILLIQDPNQPIQFLGHLSAMSPIL
jgi:hypothetical protein